MDKLVSLLSTMRNRIAIRALVVLVFVAKGEVIDDAMANQITDLLLLLIGFAIPVGQSQNKTP